MEIGSAWHPFLGWVLLSGFLAFALSLATLTAAWVIGRLSLNTFIPNARGWFVALGQLSAIGCLYLYSLTAFAAVALSLPFALLAPVLVHFSFALCAGRVLQHRHRLGFRAPAPGYAG
ncbi:hypothetical protein [Halotalea alkalilenta]|uniref:Uncharacterized protein n=1 Tax=Halotalea alkalilenta TaxID=376489 RepID=A0A172YBB9_9GAMM|nr:hypothetical protein [Halotalea alkalilenta]ANF56543.1 hypothetical protein A5892_02885 [Halotalea alkalilenta]